VYAFTNGPGGSEAPVYATWQDYPRQFHETLGLCVFALLVVRDSRRPPQALQSRALLKKSKSAMS